ncbi:MAG TPA: alpha/beta fold hydrolase [Candidatus Lustribacter sp.]
MQGVSFRQGYADANGVRTRYLQAGDAAAPALVFLHGTGGHAEAYVRNLAEHAKYFNTFAIDLLGHGYTDKPAYDYEIPRYVEHVNAFLDAVGVERASLSGESLGRFDRPELG